MKQFKKSLLCGLGLLVIGCAKTEKFPALNDKISSPSDVVRSEDSKYFYVLNTDASRDYNRGSILTLNAETGERVAVTEAPRLGRSVAVAGTDMVVTFSASSPKEKSKVHLYSLSATPETPQLQKSWEVDCTPFNVVVRKDYQYFFVACIGGDLFLGTLKNPRSDSDLKLVRRYGVIRRAMYLDTKRQQLYLFTTALGEPKLNNDAIMVDKEAYDAQGVKTEKSNEIPDGYESTSVARQALSQRGRYQAAIYDIAAEAAKGPEPFPLKEKRADLESELRWVYFDLFDADGTPDVNQTSYDPNSKYYRTNFYEARPDPQRADSFYLSHRGYSDKRNPDGSPHANNILRVTITGNPANTTKTTAQVFKFERVYGFNGELQQDGLHYPGDFEIEMVKGKPLLLVNHFRDLIYWPRSQTYFSIAAKVIGDNSWFSELSSRDGYHAYYQVALTPQGKALSCSFYGNALMLLDVRPGVDITEKPIQ